MVYTQPLYHDYTMIIFELFFHFSGSSPIWLHLIRQGWTPQQKWPHFSRVDRVDPGWEVKNLESQLPQEKDMV